MDITERLANLVVALSSQVALAQYRLAILEGEDEYIAKVQARTILATTLATVKDTEDISDEDQAIIDESLEKLLLTFKPRGPLS